MLYELCYGRTVKIIPNSLIVFFIILTHSVNVNAIFLSDPPGFLRPMHGLVRDPVLGVPVPQAKNSCSRLYKKTVI